MFTRINVSVTRLTWALCPTHVRINSYATTAGFFFLAIQLQVDQAPTNLYLKETTMRSILNTHDTGSPQQHSLFAPGPLYLVYTRFRQYG